ncbi:MAG: ATP-binding cassette domain-containing protein [Bradymonadia bacterium]
MAGATEHVIQAQGLVKVFRGGGLLRARTETRALDRVDIALKQGEIAALIGESGSGKTTLGKVLLRLTPLDEGSLEFNGADLLAAGRTELRGLRREFQMVFQNQAANLHPKMTVWQMLDESLRLHRPELDAEGRKAQSRELLEQVGLIDRGDQRPASLSGGERRRVGLARILATRPRLIVADEPTSGLDAAIKQQMIHLLEALKAPETTYLLISHDLGLVRRISERVMVMLQGRIIEDVPGALLGKAEFHHPYTHRLIQASDLLDEGGRARRVVSTGFDLEARAKSGVEVKGCVYASDCPLAAQLGIVEKCQGSRPPMVQVGPAHQVACFGHAGVSSDG